jgi:hypothetical protein
MSYETLSRTMATIRSAGTWGAAAAGMANVDLSADERWYLWRFSMRTYSAVTPLRVVRGWLRCFHHGDPLHTHYGDPVVYEALKTYPSLVAVFRGLGLSTKEILAAPPTKHAQLVKALKAERGDGWVPAASPASNANKAPARRKYVRKQPAASSVSPLLRTELPQVNVQVTAPRELIKQVIQYARDAELSGKVVSLLRTASKAGYDIEYVIELLEVG